MYFVACFIGVVGAWKHALETELFRNDCHSLKDECGIYLFTISENVNKRVHAKWPPQNNQLCNIPENVSVPMVSIVPLQIFSIFISFDLPANLICWLSNMLIRASTKEVFIDHMALNLRRIAEQLCKVVGTKIPLTI